MNRARAAATKPKKEKLESPISTVTSWIPNAMHEKLTAISKEREISISRLVAYAIFNELELGENAFSFDVTIPDEPYVEYQYAQQASTLLQVIKTFKQGAGLDMLVMARPEKIKDTRTLLLAYRELKKVEMVVEIHPSVLRVPGHYKKDYMHALPSTSESPKGPLDGIK